MKIAIIYNPTTNPENRKYAFEASVALNKANISHRINPEEKDFRKFQIALAVGGDGTLLYTANLLAKYRIPILGINFGHRGYLCEISSDQIDHAIQNILLNKYSITEKTRIQAKISRHKDSMILEALNEIAIGGINRTVYLSIGIVSPNVNIDANIAGDGLIISTQTGSTAYNINAGGSMLLFDAFSIVANNAFFESDVLLPVTKSIITPTSTKISIRNLSQKSANFPFVIADGINSLKVDNKCSITISKSNHINNFLSFK
jgi:NAD+ kinase